MTSCPGTYYLLVVEDIELAKIVASGTLVVEQKYIHEIAVVCVFIASFTNLFKVFICCFKAKKTPVCRHFILLHSIAFVSSFYCIQSINLEDFNSEIIIIRWLDECITTSYKRNRKCYFK